MSDSVEVAITSDSSDQLWSSCVWDVRTGTHLISYKGGGVSGAHTLATINGQYIVAGNLVKPMLHIWPVNRHEPIATRFIIPGRATAVAVSPDGNYCLVAVQETVYVYQLVTGAMLASISRHYQSVNVLRFTDDGSHFISAGQDGMVLVWNLANVVRVYQKQTVNTLYSFSDHAIPVTDVHVGKGGMKAIFCSVSLDRTCKIYDLTSGSMLLNLVFQEALSSVSMDNLESSVFVGSSDGPIYTFNILCPPRTKEYHIERKQLQKNIFVGHKKAVTCLSVSIDGEILLSGGADENVHIWHIKSRQQLRTIPHKGTVTNAYFMLVPKIMFNQEIKLNPLFQPFQKMALPSEKIETYSIETEVRENVRDVQRYNDDSMDRFTTLSHSGNNQEELVKLRKEIQHLKMANKEMYEFTVKNLIKNS
ncbi:WD repeat-containing protein 18 [Toxorhynchites rutilus septentrionalis]|uniref:WD repeat-containing protein 18 n=1 Tax=Toxorhynchites rutilus septentrionalis TaxID=329112 RepID=UPI00247A81D4|nr:WD repeat-containing protein 18 [Toxorhynchites rutilus septentrionalis]